jgi:hypothetical protein
MGEEKKQKAVAERKRSIWSLWYFSSILHTETVVAVQELARFRIRALPSHFLLNCAITWRENIIIWHDGCETRRQKRLFP